MAEIVEEGPMYAMEGPKGRSFATNQYDVLAHGKAEKSFPFIACSDSPFTEVGILSLESSRHID